MQWRWWIWSIVTWREDLGNQLSQVFFFFYARRKVKMAEMFKQRDDGNKNNTCPLIHVFHPHLLHSLTICSMIMAGRHERGKKKSIKSCGSKALFCFVLFCTCDWIYDVHLFARLTLFESRHAAEAKGGEKNQGSVHLHVIGPWIWGCGLTRRERARKVKEGSLAGLFTGSDLSGDELKL